jgi:C4-dicarboxylate transporter, DctM subunit
MLISGILVAVCALILLGTPIAIALGVIAIVTMYAMVGPELLVIFIQRIYAGTTSFPLLAIPFFIIAGNLMNTGGTTVRIFRFAELLVGRVRGGLGHVNVVASMIFAGMSGSAVADAAGLGVVMIKAMRGAGYSAPFSASITAVASTIGPVIPPSIPFVIYASLANVSVGALFIAGIVPGLLMGFGLMVVIAMTAKSKNLPRVEQRPTGAEARRIFLSALPALATPILVVGGMLSGIVTPTEAAVVATAYAAFLGRFVYRELTFRGLLDAIWISGRQTVQVMFIIAAAAPFGWILIQQQIPNAVINGLLGLTTTPWIILLVVNVILLVLGMFIEGIAIMIITFPILLPVMVKIGVDPIHFGVIMVLNLMIGLVTPPVGLVLFAVSAISQVSIAEMVAEMWPYVIALLVVLGVVTYLPELVMWLPNLYRAA